LNQLHVLDNEYIETATQIENYMNPHGPGYWIVPQLAGALSDPSWPIQGDQTPDSTRESRRTHSGTVIPQGFNVIIVAWRSWKLSTQ